MQPATFIYYRRLKATFLHRSLDGWLAQAENRVPTANKLANCERANTQVLQYSVLKNILWEDLRGMRRRPMGCPLFQWICVVDRMEEMLVPTESQLGRYGTCLHQAAPRFHGLWLAKDLKVDTVVSDRTCVDADIDFPVDGVMPRDGTRTLMNTTALIRQHGLKCRIQGLGKFLCAMNRQCIAMAQAGKQRIRTTRANGCCARRRPCRGEGGGPARPASPGFARRALAGGRLGPSAARASAGVNPRGART